MTQRRIVPTHTRIESYIEAGQRRGLTTSSVEMYPDGKVVIHFGEHHSATLKETEKPRGWGIKAGT